MSHKGEVIMEKAIKTSIITSLQNSEKNLSSLSVLFTAKFKVKRYVVFSIINYDQLYCPTKAQTMNSIPPIEVCPDLSSVLVAASCSDSHTTGN